ncbi:sensor histidine kinase [Ectobacillus antri]|jgi:two-component system sensor histidine kinase DctS|uniref:histidine kinase n=1 Tax=Ectobacillus antri TaxID=2486280 RepID=A0ABT6H728_9BACI|nr:sensor histidine kinase [Ectobacillus antri]MDG4657365.1 sensor histidine kinase [Ectobacillus antri]MDG5754504.1 sensor histidine kinase [Ectobacillus antri]
MKTWYNFRGSIMKWRCVTGKTTLRVKIGLLVFSLVIVSSAISASLLISEVFRATEREAGQRAMSIARTTAKIESIVQHVTTPNGSSVIQPITEEIRLATNVEYIVVYDMSLIRKSHPVSSKIGTVFTGGDEGPSLSEHAYVSKAYGVKGPSVRAFVPIMQESKQVGVVVVGILSPTYMELVKRYINNIELPFFVALLVGLVGAFFLARNIKQQMFNMEPLEIAMLLEERGAVFQSIGEGVVAIDRKYCITVINPEAARILKLSNNLVGASSKEILPEVPFKEVLQSGQARYHEERVVRGTRILVSVLPISIKGKIVGAAATIRDKTEVFNLAEELTGVKQFIEALRVQNHEHRNKLHVIAGLIQLGQTKQALHYVFDVVDAQEELFLFLAERICDHSISGLLIGKISRARELGILLQIDYNSQLNEFPKNWDAGILLTVLGNLLDNSIEALQNHSASERVIRCGIYDQASSLQIIVQDNGPGIAEAVQQQIYHQGFSTKLGNNRGIGLALVERYTKSARGTIQLETSVEKGTTFTITIPKQVEEVKLCEKLQ